MIQHDDEPVVSHARARTLAVCWQDEHDVDAPLTVLAVTGAISEATLSALRSDLNRLEQAAEDSGVEEPTAARGQLRALLRYVSACGERGPVAGWTGLKDRDILSDRSVPDRAPAPATRERVSDRVVPFPSHRARPAEDLVPLASRRTHAAVEDDGPFGSRLSRFREESAQQPAAPHAEDLDDTAFASRRARFREEVGDQFTGQPRGPRFAEGATERPVAGPRPPRYGDEPGDQPAPPARPARRARFGEQADEPGSLEPPVARFRERGPEPPPYGRDRARFPIDDPLPVTPVDDDVVSSALDGPYGDSDWNS